jgi:hypothetical protein
MSDSRLLPDGGCNGASNSTTDPGPKGQHSDDSGHVLVRDGSLGRYTGPNHTECATKGNEDLGPDECNVTIKFRQSSTTLRRGGAVRCVFATSVERKPEGDYPNAQAKYLKVLRKELKNCHFRVETDPTVTL